MSKALQVAEPVSFVAGKNAVINGGMDVWQRGTSFTPSSSTITYAADRWWVYRTATGFTASQQTSAAPNQKYALRLQRTASNAATNNLYLIQTIESLNCYPLQGKSVTFSFYAQAGANFSGSAIGVNVYTGTAADQGGSAGGWTGLANPLSTTQAITTTTTRYSFTFTVPATALEIQLQLDYLPSGTAGAADYVDISGVQLELGSVATPFSRAGGTIQGELAACQRYFEKSYDQTVNPATATTIGSCLTGAGIGASAASTTGYILAGCRWKVEKRVTPTVTVYDAAGNSGVVTAINPGVGNTNGNALYISDIGTAGAQIGRDGSTGTRTAVNAIQYQYTANAEL